MKKDIKGRAALVWEYGQYITVRSCLEFNVMLYSVDKFFVEVWYDSTKNKIAHVQALKDLETLNPYLLLISINDVFLEE